MPTKKTLPKVRNRTIKTEYPKALGTNEYWTKYNCDNCGWSGSIKFQKGTIAPDTAVCPTCICFKAKKSLPIVRREPAPLPLLKDPIIPTPMPPWPRVHPIPAPMPPTHPYDPWQVPNQPYRPWAEPIRPHLEREITGPQIDSDNDASDRQGFELW